MSTQTSIIYKNIHFYRFTMRLIYGGKYVKRFRNIIKIIEDKTPKSILDICFGDIIIADYCKEKNIVWKGIDLNYKFVEHAKAKGYDAVCTDILLVESFPKVDMCVISGSLYHFTNEQQIQLLRKMFSAANRIIISEPIRNLSDNKGLIGYIAKRSANAGKGNEHFRFNEQSFIAMLEENKLLLNFSYSISAPVNKDMIVLLEKNGSH